MRELLLQYLNKEITAIKLIRVLSGMFNPDHAVDILALINQITRIEFGDMDPQDFREMWKLDEEPKEG